VVGKWVLVVEKGGGGLRSTGLEDFQQKMPAETNFYENEMSFLA
jgi:hypothetical protein